MTFLSYATVLGAPARHTTVFYVIIGIVGLLVVAAIVVSLLVLVLRNINRQWPVR